MQAARGVNERGKPDPQDTGGPDPEGLSVSHVLELLNQRGVVMAEATFRKYVQLGLLPRSRRVGRKGKHQGSHGLYPRSVVERITQIRGLMDQGLTIEEIQRTPLAFAHELDAVRSGSEAFLRRLEAQLALRRAPAEPEDLSGGEERLLQLRQQVEALLDALERAAEELCPMPAPAGGFAPSPSHPSAPAQERS